MAELAAVYRHLGNRLRVLRDGRKLTQAQLAEAIGRGSEYISAVERGRKRIQLEDLAKAAHALGVSFGELFTGIPVREPARNRASDRTARYERRGRIAPSADSVATLAQLVALLDDADVTTLTTVAQRLVALGLSR
jgi:transcriptional regulator with XRE-family HTH domain